MRKNEEEQGMKLIHCALNILLGGALALGSCLLFLLLASVGISLGWVEDGLMYQLTIIGCVLGCLVGGFIAVRRCGGKALLVGLAVGAVMFLLLLTAGLLFLDGASLENGGVGLLCGCLCGGAAAGLLGSGMRPRRKAGKPVKR